MLVGCIIEQTHGPVLRHFASKGKNPRPLSQPRCRARRVASRWVSAVSCIQLHRSLNLTWAESSRPLRPPRLADAFKQFEENQNSQAFLAAVQKVTGVMAHSTQSYQILRFAESSCTNPYDPENKPVQSDASLRAGCARAFVALVETV
jgi:hypothetical protein